MSKNPYYSFVCFGLVLILLATASQKETISYWQVATVENTSPEEPFILQVYNDTVSNDDIYLHMGKDSMPLHYYKKVMDEVCFDKKCRLLDIDVYWNITGRYLGFELSEGEFLSKSDHEPFSHEEYQQLHALLADESLPLDRTTFEELLEPTPEMSKEVDGYSGATSKSLAAMVVKGAAYTTYKLWNIVNGPTMDLVSDLTESRLSENLLNQIMQSQKVADKIWALDRIGDFIELSLKLESTLLGLISSDDFYLTYSAINAINSNHLRSGELQKGLFEIYLEASHDKKRSIISKLIEAPFLSTVILDASRDLLTELNGQQLKDFLRLFAKHNIDDAITQKAVAQILRNENRYISKIAFTFLSEQEINDPSVTILLNDYKNQKL